MTVTVVGACLRKTGGNPVFLVSEVVARAPTGSRANMVGRRPGWSHALLEPFLTAAPGDQHPPVGGLPFHRARDPRLAGERAEAIPQRRGDGERQLLVCPAELGVHPLSVVQQGEHHPADVAAGAGAAAERNGGADGAESIELGEHGVGEQQLAT